MKHKVGDNRTVRQRWLDWTGDWDKLIDDMPSVPRDLVEDTIKELEQKPWRDGVKPDQSIERVHWYETNSDGEMVIHCNVVMFNPYYFLDKKWLPASELTLPLMPEVIAPCPFPECEFKECHVHSENGFHWVECACGYSSGACASKQKAINIHNELCEVKG